MHRCIRPSLLKIASELGELARLAEDPATPDERMDCVGDRGEELIDELCAIHALSLGDVLLKLDAWTRLPGGFWPIERIVRSATLDLMGILSHTDGEVEPA